MTRILSIVASVFLASPAAAAICGEDTSSDIPMFETAKTAFKSGDYRTFTRIVGNFFPDLKDNYDGYFGKLDELFPEGYDRCTTILQRREDPGFYQDMVLFFPKGYDAPMAVLLIGAKIDGEVRMIEFNYNTNISGVLDELK